MPREWPKSHLVLDELICLKVEQVANVLRLQTSKHKLNYTERIARARLRDKV